MHGIGNGLMEICKNWPGLKTAASLSADGSEIPGSCASSLPSMVISAGERECGETLSWIVESLGSRTGRKLSDLGQMGVRSRDCTEGCTMGPPAERE